MLKQAQVFDPKRLFGVTTLDVVRAQTFSAEVLQQPTASPDFKIPVIGGHSGVTILPLLSQAQPSLASLDQAQIEKLTNRIQFGGDEVVKAKDGKRACFRSVSPTAHQTALRQGRAQQLYQWQRLATALSTACSKPNGAARLASSR